MKNINKKGFTLIEMLVVVLIIGILAAVALPQYFKAVEKSRSTEALSVMGSISAAMERARLVSSDNTYPTTLSSLDIEIADNDGSTVTDGAWESNNFSFEVKGTSAGSGANDGRIIATRKGSSGYTLTRWYYSGKVSCVDTESSGATSVTGICTSLGLTNQTSQHGGGGQQG